MALLSCSIKRGLCALHAAPLVRGWVGALLLLITMPVAAQTDDPVLLTVGGIDVTRSEFAYSYERNVKQSDEELSVDDFLERFIDYKLKLRAAMDAGIAAPEVPTAPVAVATPVVASDATTDTADADYLYQLACHHAGNGDVLLPSQILLRVDTRASQAAEQRQRARIDSVWQALQQGADFAALARRLSDDALTAARGGLMGWTWRGQLTTEMEQQCIALQAGEMSPPFRTPAGFVIVMMNDRQPVSSPTVKASMAANTAAWTAQAADAQPLAQSVQQPVPADENMLREYREGVMVDIIEHRMVWDGPDADEDTLYKYFKKNRERFGDGLKKKDFPKVRDLVAADYRQVYEQQWVERLHKRYKVKVNKKILKTLR